MHKQTTPFCNSYIISYYICCDHSCDVYAYILCVCPTDACTTHAAHYVRTLRMHAVINSQNLFMRENNNYHIFPLPPCLLHECAGVKSSLAACRGRVIYFDLSSAVVTKIQHWTFFQFCRGFSVNESITLQADEIFRKIFLNKKHLGSGPLINVSAARLMTGILIKLHEYM